MYKCNKILASLREGGTCRLDTIYYHCHELAIIMTAARGPQNGLVCRTERAECAEMRLLREPLRRYLIHVHIYIYVYIERERDTYT